MAESIRKVVKYAKINGIIYKAENLITHKSYIGQTIKLLKTRKHEHYSSPGKVKTFFHKALLKHPKEDWTWNVECNIEAPTQILLKEYLNITENIFIEQEDTLVPNGYNLTLGGEGSLGLHPSKKTREKMSLNKMSDKNPMYGTHLNEEAKKKISGTNKGRIFSEEHKQKLSKTHLYEKNPNYGKHWKLSEEHKQKIGIACKGRIPWNKGKQLSEEHKRKLSETHKGKALLKETRQKISETLKKYWGKRRNTNV